MELQNSREYKAAQELERALNDMGWSPKRFAESTRFYHRTLQQELMRTIVAVIRMVGDDSYRTDLRNQASHELCKRIFIFRSSDKVQTTIIKRTSSAWCPLLFIN